jgi:hypothetical protein
MSIISPRIENCIGVSHPMISLLYFLKFCFIICAQGLFIFLPDQLTKYLCLKSFMVFHIFKCTFEYLPKSSGLRQLQNCGGPEEFDSKHWHLSPASSPLSRIAIPCVISFSVQSFISSIISYSSRHIRPGYIYCKASSKAFVGFYTRNTSRILYTIRKLFWDVWHIFKCLLNYTE